LNFAWIAEPWHRKGVLSRRWPQWLATYGEFMIDHARLEPDKPLALLGDLVLERHAAERQIFSATSGSRRLG
jgi:hypothetical protein